MFVLNARREAETDKALLIKNGDFWVAKSQLEVVWNQGTYYDLEVEDWVWEADFQDHFAAATELDIELHKALRKYGLQNSSQTSLNFKNDGLFPKKESNWTKRSCVVTSLQRQGLIAWPKGCLRASSNFPDEDPKKVIEEYVGTDEEIRQASKENRLTQKVHQKEKAKDTDEKVLVEDWKGNKFEVKKKYAEKKIGNGWKLAEDEEKEVVVEDPAGNRFTEKWSIAKHNVGEDRNWTLIEE